MIILSSFNISRLSWFANDYTDKIKSKIAQLTFMDTETYINNCNFEHQK